MTTKAPVILTENLIKYLIEEIDQDPILRQMLYEAVFSIEPVDWETQLIDVFSNNPQIKTLLSAKLGVKGPDETSSGAAMRYGIHNRLKPVNYFSAITTPEQLKAVTDELDIYNADNYYSGHQIYHAEYNKVFTPAKDTLYLDYMPSKYFLGDTATLFPEKIKNNANLKGLEFKTDEDNIVLNKIKCNGPVYNLTPATITQEPTWQFSDGCFTIDPTHDYHFSFEMQLCVNHPLTEANGISPDGFARIEGLLSNPTLDDVYHDMEYMVYARLHNGAEDDTANMNKLVDSFKPFYLLSQGNITSDQIKWSTIEQNYYINASGGFRLRGYIDQYLNPGAVNAGMTLLQRPTFKHVDFIFAFKNKIKVFYYITTFLRPMDVYNSAEPDKDLRSYFNIVDLGKVIK